MRAPWAPALLAGLLLLPALAALPGEGDGDAPERAIVQLARPLSPEERAELAARGAVAWVGVIPAAVVEMAPAHVGWVRAQPWALRVEPDAPLERHLDLATRLIRAGPPVLDLGVDGSGITVAVLDSGIDATHPDLQGRVRANVVWAGNGWAPTLADPDGHGTHVAGIVAGTGQASQGALRGVAPGAGLVGMDFSRSFTTATALQAFDWVLRNRDALGIRVVQNSWGRAERPAAWDPADSLVRASDRLVGEGLVVVFSAGNHGPNRASLSLEAQNPNVITVGAVDDAALAAGFSGRGPVLDAAGSPQAWVKPDVVAGGVGVRSARSALSTGPIRQPSLLPSQLPGLGAPAEAPRYVDLSGTSQAAPHVAGIAALMLQANPALTPAQVHDLLRETAIDLGEPGPDPTMGFGLVDARDAVRRALGMEEDRANILLAGGQETYEVRGRVAGLGGQLVQTGPVPQVRPEGAVEAQAPVKVGATHARFTFAWTGAATGFRVFLVGPAATLGPWTESRAEGGERVIAGDIEDPDPGMYTLLARPLAPVETSYRATLTVSVREAAARPAELEERFRAPPPQGPIDQLASELDFEVAKLRRALPGAELAGVVLAVALAAAVRRR